MTEFTAAVMVLQEARWSLGAAAGGQSVRDHQVDRVARRATPGQSGIVGAATGTAPPALTRKDWV